MDLKYVIYIGGTPEQVWNALTTPEGTRAIFFNSVLQSTFEIGSPYAYVGPGNDGDETVHVYGEVLAFEPHKLMRFTEHPGPSYRENHATLETKLSLSLETVGESTKLMLINDDWPADHPSYDNTKESWPMILSNIKSYVETGKALNFGW
ncbi:SRPBCC domain-containing protein [Paenibacillus sp. NEAU-GSW1]|uniref:SRPBCC domain-containing protein n=1 Tax=Paenibacillus sp. NEAU-GSW1 TaxID=2682486 RepID=UPI0012E1A617|nr:SRPBCC domain-containing protein [Paenibacillus sp. NEAU-GSW1]MUT67487.1 polyketide cyclase [Paenibacillus sp. NEAU-GSW1]